jgi:hypothetical protein
MVAKVANILRYSSSYTLSFHAEVRHFSHNTPQLKLNAGLISWTCFRMDHRVTHDDPGSHWTRLGEKGSCRLCMAPARFPLGLEP